MKQFGIVLLLCCLSCNNLPDCDNKNISFDLIFTNQSGLATHIWVSYNRWELISENCFLVLDESVDLGIDNEQTIIRTIRCDGYFHIQRIRIGGVKDVLYPTVIDNHSESQPLVYNITINSDFEIIID